MASPDIVSSINHPRHFTLGRCLICISPYFMLSFLMFFFFNLEKKSIDFVLSSPKRILNLLSTYYLHLLSTFSYYSISLIYYVDKPSMNHEHTEMTFDSF